MVSQKRKEKKATALGGGRRKTLAAKKTMLGGAQGSYDDILMWAAALAIVLLLTHKFIGDDPTIRYLKQGRIIDSRWIRNLFKRGKARVNKSVSCSEQTFGAFPKDLKIAGNIACAAEDRSMEGFILHALFVLGFGGSTVKLVMAIYEKMK